MIIKARAGTGGQALARYLMGGKNEQAEVLELRNMDAASLRQAIYQMDASALGAKCEKHALHVQMRAAVGERITPDQWRDAVRRYANSFGMEEHHAAVILHLNPDGSTHCHAVFNRVHPQTLKAAHLSNNYAVHKDLAREIERDWGLERVSNQKQEQKRDYSNRGMGETQQARRAGRDVHAIRDLIRAAWERAENGEEFGHALEAGGFLLARGDRRDFLAVDEHGHPYSIGSRTTGARAAEVRAKLQDLDPATVPTLEEAREAQRQAQRERERKEGERRKAAEMEAQRQAEADRQAEAERQEQARRREAEERRKAAEIEAQQRAEAKRREQERRAEARQQKEERRQAAETKRREQAEQAQAPEPEQPGALKRLFNRWTTPKTPAAQAFEKAKAPEQAPPRPEQTPATEGQRFTLPTGERVTGYGFTQPTPQAPGNENRPEARQPEPQPREERPEQAPPAPPRYDPDRERAEAWERLQRRFQTPRTPAARGFEKAQEPEKAPQPEPPRRNTEQREDFNKLRVPSRTERPASIGETHTPTADLWKADRLARAQREEAARQEAARQQEEAQRQKDEGEWERTHAPANGNKPRDAAEEYREKMRQAQEEARNRDRKREREKAELAAELLKQWRENDFGRER